MIVGIAGTLVMTGVGLWAAPMMGIPRMNPADMLAGAMGGNVALRWLGHLMIGVVLAVTYAAVSLRLPGPPVVRGAIYGLAPWIVAMLVVMPMMRMPIVGRRRRAGDGKLDRPPGLRRGAGRDLWHPAHASDSRRVQPRPAIS